MLRDILSPKILAVLALIFLLIAAVDLAAPGRAFMPDESRFYDEARVMWEEGRFVTFGFYRAWEMPGLAVIYAALYGAAGGGSAFIRAVRITQAFALILTAAGAASLAFSIFKNRLTALIVLFSVTIYPSFLAYQCLLLSETLFTCFLAWGFALLYRWEDENSVPAASALCFMLALYIKPTLTFLTPALVAVRSLYVVRSWRRRILHTALACAIFAACMSPWWVRNWLIFGRFVPYTTSASWNLYLGNNPNNHRAGVDWDYDVDTEKVKEIFAIRDELKISGAFMAEGKAYIMSDKAAFLKNALLKFKRFWNVFLNANPEQLPRYFRYYNIASAMSWGAAFPLALASAWLNRRRWLKLFPIFTLIVYYTLIHMAVISSLRYRAPIEPFFIILGADCLRRICVRLRAAGHDRQGAEIS